MLRKMIVQGDDLVDLVYANAAQMQGVADHCRAMRESGAEDVGDVRLLGVIPAELVEKYCIDAGVTFADFMHPGSEHASRMLNDPALSGFRVHRGRVS